MKLKITIVSLVVLFVSSCTQYKYSMDYHFNVDQVEVNGVSQIDSVNSSLYFKDSVLEVAWTVSEKQLVMDLKNVSDKSFQILWDEAAIVDEKGESKKVLHLGVYPKDANQPQAPTTVVNGSFLHEVISSSSNVSPIVVNTRYNGGSEYYESIYVVNKGKSVEKLQAKAKSELGNFIGVSLPIKIDGSVKVYTFYLKKNAINQTTIKKTEPLTMVFLGTFFTMLIVIAASR